MTILDALSTKTGTVVHSYNAGTQEAEAGGLLGV